ncbi:MAG: hypothetical protein AB8B77_04505 [Alphaproteobacteria bacterium]
MSITGISARAFCALAFIHLTFAHSTSFVFAQEQQGSVSGYVEALQGSATATSDDGESVRVLKMNDPVYAQETIRTDFDGVLKLKLIDDTIFTLSKQAIFHIDQMIYDPDNPGSNHAIFTALQGAFFFISGKISKVKPENMMVNTPIGTIAIRGTAVAGNVYVDGADVMEASLISGAIDIKDDRTGQTYVVENNFTTFQSAASGVQLEQQDAATMLSANRTQLSILDETELAIIESQLEDEAEIETQQISETITSLRNIIDPEIGLDFPIGLEPPPISLFEDDPNPPQNEGTETLKEILVENETSENAAAASDDPIDLGGKFTSIGFDDRDYPVQLDLEMSVQPAQGESLLANGSLDNGDPIQPEVTQGDPQIKSASNLVWGTYALNHIKWGEWESSDAVIIQYGGQLLSPIHNHGHWVVGDIMPENDMPVSGKAWLNAEIKGDLSVGSPSLNNDVTGDMFFEVDLNSKSIAGEAAFEYSEGSRRSDFTVKLKDTTFSGSAFSTGYGTITSADSSFFSVGDDLVGAISGNLYGNSSTDLLEVAGAWNWSNFPTNSNSDISAAGVFAGTEQTADMKAFDGMMVYAANRNIMTSAAVLKTGDNLNVVNTDPNLSITGGDAVIANFTSSVVIDGDDTDLSYVGWGEWASAAGGAPSTIEYKNDSNIATTGFVVGVTDKAGYYTDPDDLPQTGSANFAGIVQGVFDDDAALTGTIGMNVDFASNAITGDMALERDNAAWVSPNINGTLGGAGEFSADLLLSSIQSGTMDGALLGTSQNPTEAMGAFDVTDGTNSASGVFVAARQ